MISKIKKPVSILLALMMVVSLFAIVPITASATDYVDAYPMLDELAAGDTLSATSDGGTYVIGQDYSLIIQGGTYRARMDFEPEANDTALQAQQISISIFRDEYGPLLTVTTDGIPHEYYPLDAEGNPSDKWYVLSNENNTVTLAGQAPAPAVPVDYYVVGTMNSWNISEDYKMVLNENNTSEYWIQNVPLHSGDEIKVVSSTDGSTVQYWYPDGTGNNLAIGEDGYYNVYVAPAGHNTWHYNCILATKQSDLNYVAQIGDNKYETLEAAVAAAPAGATVKLLENIDYSEVTKNRNAHDRGEELKIDLKDLTLDLDGHTIKTVNASVVFTGSGATIENGNFALAHINASGAAQNGSYGLCIDGYNADNANITLNDLTVEGGINVWKKAKVAINNVTATTTASKYYAIWAEDEGTEVVVNSGTFTDAQTGGKGVLATGTAADEAGAKIYVKGGTFNASNKLVSSAEADSIKISGGTFTKPVAEEYCADGYIPKDNGDNTYGVKTGAYVAQVGTAKYETLDAAIAAAQAGDTVTLLADITLPAQSISGESAKYGAYITKSLTIDGDGHTVTSDAPRAFGVKGTQGDIDVTFKNITVTDKQQGAICVCTRGGINSLTLDNATLSTQGATKGYIQPLTIGGSQATKAKVDVINSTIQTGDAAGKHYAIILWNPVDLTIQNSTIKGWACVYQKAFEDASAGVETKVTIDNSTLISKGIKGSSNHFATIFTENAAFTCKITNTTMDITAAADTYQAVAASNGSASGFKVELGEGNNVTLTGDTALIGYNFDDENHEIAVSGGTFNKPVAEYYCADGYIPATLDEETGKYSVKTGAYVAQVNGVKYETLEAAVAAISTVTSEYHSKSGLTINKYKANGTIKLLANCSGNGIVIDSGSNLTIDFDGHTYDVTGDLVGSNGTESLGFQLKQNSDVTFTNGTITSEKAQMIVQNYSNLTLNNMVLDGTKMAGDGNYVLSNNNGNVVINDTTINARANCIAFDVCRFSSYPSVNVTVTGNSHINGNVEVYASKSDAKDGFSLNLNGGDMSGAIVLDPSAKAAMAAAPKKVSVNKATTFDKTAPEGYVWVDTDTEGVQTIAKAVAQVGDNKYATLEAAVAAISTVTSEYHSKSGLTINKYKANGTIKLLANCSGNGIVIDSGSNLTIDFDGHTYDVTGDLVGSNGTESLGFQLKQNSDVTFTNGTITSEKAQMIVQNYSNLTLNNMVLDGTKMAGDGNYVLSNNNGNVVINDTTINARANCIAFDVCRFSSYPSVNVTVTGNSHINGNVEVYASKSDAKDGFSLNLNGGDMSGDIVLDKTAKNVLEANPDKLSVTKAADFEKAAPADYKWDNDGKLVPCKYVAQVGDNKYETLEEAVAAISTVTPEYHSKSGLTINKYKANGTIKLLANCSGNGIVIDSGSNLTIDFDGHTYDVTGDLVGSNGTESLGFQLKQNSDVTFTNGTITSEKAQMIVQNYSNLTLNNMVLDGTKMAGDGNYVLSNNNGNVVINDTTINAREGKIAFDVCRYASYPSVNVTVTGNSHINGNVEVFASKSDPKNGFSLNLNGGTMTGAIVLAPSAKAAMDATPEKASVNKATTFDKAAPEGYKWVDKEGKQTLAKIEDLFVAHSITLDGNIKLNFFINPDYADFKNADSAYVKFSWDGNTTEVNLKTAVLSEDGWYKASVELVAAEMANVVHAEVYRNNDMIGEDNYTVREYAEKLYNHPEEYDKKGKSEELRALAKALLNYGAMAQTVFAGDFTVQPEDFANANLDAEDKTAYESVTAAEIGAAIPEQASDMNKVADKLGGKFYTSSVIYLNKNTLRLYFTPNTYPGTLPYGDQYTRIVEDYYYYVESQPIPATKLDQQQHFKIGGVEFNYSALDYAKAVVERNKSTEAVNLAKALFCYNQAAKAYIG